MKWLNDLIDKVYDDPRLFIFIVGLILLSVAGLHCEISMHITSAPSVR